ncbi:MAG: response regulator [Deltaproteobacteria bacterium]|nr:response regulator [Deltaproteobacteria bacterium]
MITAADTARILVVDDDAKVREGLQALLSQAGYEVVLAEDGRRALSLVRELSPDLVVLDLIMPGYDGMQVLRILKATTSTFLPVIILTAKKDMDGKLQGLKLGADDYLTKPADDREVLARIEALLRIKRLQDRVAPAQHEERDAAMIDPVSDLYNARYLKSRLADEFERAERYSEPLACILLRLDGLPGLHAEHGEAEIERVIRSLADGVAKSIREFDVAVRAADDKFVILLPRTHFSGSIAVASRLWQKARAVSRLGPVAFEMSMGVAFFPNPEVKTAADLLDRASQAESRAREEGRDQICLFQNTAYFYHPEAD